MSKVYDYKPTDGFYDIESVEDAFTISHYSPKANVVNIFTLWGENRLEQLTDADRQKIKDKVYEVNPVLKDTGAKVNVFNGITEFMFYLVPLFADQMKETSSAYNTWNKITNRNPYVGNATLTKNPFVDDAGNNDTRVYTYQLGFNSKAYDMAMLAYVISAWTGGNLPIFSEDWAKSMSYITPKTIKDMSNKVINAPYPSQVEALSYREPAGQILTAMSRSTRFADIRLLLGKSAKLTLGLKRYAAQAGWKILESELVKGQESLHTIANKLNTKGEYVTPVDLLADVIGYNVLDVLNTQKLFEMDDWQTGMKQHQQLLERFEDSFEGKLYVDSTNSKFIEYVIVPNNGGQPIRLKDSPEIDFHYPTKNGMQDLLEVAKKMGIPDELYNFYDNYRGSKTHGDVPGIIEGQEKVLKDPRMQKALDEGRLSPKGTTLDIWVQDPQGNVNNSHANVSVGGAHGEYASHDNYIAAKNRVSAFEQEQQMVVDYFTKDLATPVTLLMGPEEAKQKEKEMNQKRLAFSKLVNEKDDNGNFKDSVFTKGPFVGTWPMRMLVTVNSKRITPKKMPSFSEVPGDYVKVIFGENIVHVDVDSLYPTLLDALETLMRNDGHDIYGDLRVERLKLKKSLPEHKSEYTEKDWQTNAVQLLNKLLLNSATGAADANFDTNILVPNKIVSMRIIGNLLIYILSMKLAEIGGTLTSINTDGLYVQGLTEDQVQPIVDEWKELFQLSADPEVIDRFVSKDANNRLEVTNDKIDYAGGGSFSAWKKPSLMKSVSKPAMMDETLANYLAHEDNPLDAFDEDWIYNYIQDRIINAVTPEQKAELLLKFQWIFTGSASKNRHFYQYDPVTGDYEAMSNISRAFITKPDYSNKKIKLLSAAKGNATDDPIAHRLLSRDEVPLNFEAGQHLINSKELAVDQLISEIKQLRKKTTDVPQFYADHRQELDDAASIMGVPSAQYAPLALTGDFKKFTDFYKNTYKNTMIGANSRILRVSFIASPRVSEEMSFVVNNDGLAELANTDLLSHIDVQSYVNLVRGEWTLWASDHYDM